MTNKTQKLLSLFCISILLFSIFSFVGLGREKSKDTSKKIVMVKEDIDSFGLDRDGFGIQTIDEYGEYSLVKMDLEGIKRLREKGMKIDELPGRTEISVKGHTFDIFQDSPDLDPDLMIDNYRSGEEGLYLVHMLGPINPEWREALKEKGVEIVNYVPNYAYEIRMTPEQAEKVEDLFFVDWVGIYQPGFKLAENPDTGLVDVKFTEKAGQETLNRISSKVSSFSDSELSGGYPSLTAEVQTHETQLNWLT